MSLPVSQSAVNISADYDPLPGGGKYFDDPAYGAVVPVFAEIYCICIDGGGGEGIDDS